jgi:soluble lytic murein transglycosylase
MKRKRRSGKDTPRVRKAWTIVCVLFVMAIGLLARGVLIYRVYPLEYEKFILKYSEEYELDPYLVCAMIKAESGFNPNAVSSENAMGLMQLMRGTAQDIANRVGIQDFSDEMLFDPETNIRLGCAYIHYLDGLFDGNTDYVIAAYNWGLGNVREWVKTDPKLENIPAEETANYLKKVKAFYEMYRNLYKL